MAKTLIVDDDDLVRIMLAQSMELLGHEARCAANLDECLRLASEEEFDVILLDVRLPDGNGLSAIPRLRARSSAPEVIIITGEGDPDGAEMAIKNGAWDYIEKPASISRMSLPVTRALERRAERRRRRPAVLRRERVLGASPQIEACLERLAEAAAGDAPTLITGPTGSGKEVFARTLHENSPRAGSAFVVVDCAAMPEHLVESLLFGHAKGAFTGADRDREGLVAQADGGTLFLDEIGELPLSLQRAFLRVLQEKTFRPVGGKVEKRSDFRLVAATNRDLSDMVAQGGFREDLFFRIRGAHLVLPPLAEREGDVRALAPRFMAEYCERLGMAAKGYAPEFLDALEAYAWPGNIRELRLAVEKAVDSARYESVLHPAHLPMDVRISIARNSVRGSAVPIESPAAPPAAPPSPVFPDGALGDWRSYRDVAMGEHEKRYFGRLLRETGGDVRKAAERSGLTRARIYGIAKKHALLP